MPCGGAPFENGERFVVACAIEAMGKAWIDRGGEFSLEGEDSLGCRLQAIEMRGGVSVAGGVIGDDGKSFAKCFRELRVDGFGRTHCAWVEASRSGTESASSIAASAHRSMAHRNTSIFDDVTILRLVHESLTALLGVPSRIPRPDLLNLPSAWL